MTKALTKQDRPKYLSGYSKYACLIHKIDTFYALIGKKKNSASFFLKTKLVEGSNFDILDRYQILQPWKRVLIFLFPMPFFGKSCKWTWKWWHELTVNAVLLLQKYYFGLFSIPHKKEEQKSYIGSICRVHLQFLTAACKKNAHPQVTCKSWEFKCGWLLQNTMRWPCYVPTELQR